MIMILLSSFVSAEYERWGPKEGEGEAAPGVPGVDKPKIQEKVYFICMRATCEDITTPEGEEKKAYKRGEGFTASIREFPASVLLNGFVELPEKIYNLLESGNYNLNENNEIILNPSNQEWSRGLNQYQTTIQTKYRVNPDGTITKAVEETVRKKLSQSEKDAIDADPTKTRDGDLSEPIKRTGISQDSYKGKVLSQKDYVLDKNGNEIESFETTWYAVDNKGTKNEKIKTTYSLDIKYNGEIFADFNKDGETSETSPFYQYGGDIDKWVNEPRISEDEKNKRKDFRQNYLDEVSASQIPWGYKLRIMDVWRIAGSFVHAFNAYKGLAKLGALIFDPDDLARVQKRKQEIQEQFCVIGGLAQCVTSLICEGWTLKPDADNFVLTKGPDNGVPTGTALIVGERSNPIQFKTTDRQELIDLLGDYAYINGVKVDFATADLSKLGTLTMWLYSANLRVNNPLNKDLHVNIEFRGPEKKGRWYSDWRKVKKGEGVTKSFIKYSTTDYNQICIIFKENIEEFLTSTYETLWLKTVASGAWMLTGIATGGAGIAVGPGLPGIMHWTDTIPLKDYKSEYCSYFVGAGKASSMDGNKPAANALAAGGDFGDGAEV